MKSVNKTTCNDKLEEYEAGLAIQHLATLGGPAPKTAYNILLQLADDKIEAFPRSALAPSFASLLQYASLRVMW